MTVGRPKREDGRNAHTVAGNKYNAGTYDRLNIMVKKGQREKIKEYAAGKGESLNALINRLLYQEMGESFEALGTEPATKARSKN